MLVGPQLVPGFGLRLGLRLAQQRSYHHRLWRTQRRPRGRGEEVWALRGGWRQRENTLEDARRDRNRILKGR